MNSDMKNCIVQVFVPQQGSPDNKGQLATGYPIAPGLILTAKHVFEKGNGDKERVKIRWHALPGKQEWQQCRIVWESGDLEDGEKESEFGLLDAALIEVDSFPEEVKVYGSLTTFEPLSSQQWCSEGYAKIDLKENADRPSISMGGDVHSKGEKYNYFEIDTNKKTNIERGWKGASGSPVFVNNRLLGIINKCWEGFEGTFLATPVWKLLEIDDFREILNEKNIRKPNYDQLPKENDSFFLKKIRNNIADELNFGYMSQFNNQLQSTLKELFTELQLDELKDLSSEGISKGLIQALGEHEGGVLVIRRALTKAASECLNSRGSCYAKCFGKRKDIKRSIQQLVGWLVTASVEEHYVVSLHPTLDHDGIYFEIPVESLGGVELIVSRRFQRAAHFDSMEPSEVWSSHALLVDESRHSWKQSTVVEELKKDIWSTVFCESRERNLTVTDIKKLNAALKGGREDIEKVKHHYVILDCPSEEDHEEKWRLTFQQLLSELPELTLARFGVGEGRSVLYSPEFDLMEAVNSFLQKLERWTESELNVATES